jgi:hypothetical protein
VPQHVSESPRPFCDESIGQLLNVLLRGWIVSPHVRLSSKLKCVFGDKLPNRGQVPEAKNRSDRHELTCPQS